MLQLENETQLIAATLLTGKYDVNRNEQLLPDDFSLVEKWYHSLMANEIKGVIFHNTFSQATVNKYQNECVTFVKVKFDSPLNPNAFRYLIYQDLLKKHREKIKHLFVTDIADVELIHSPFQQQAFLDAPGYLFCGDEPKTLNDPWMQAHGDHLRANIPDYAQHETAHQLSPLLNCGIIGGDMPTMSALMDKLAHIHQTITTTNKTSYTLDMGAFNYVARKYFAGRLKHGSPINTVFKGYEYHRNDCWFRHK